MSKYPTLTLRKGKERMMAKRHPWLFSGAVKDVPGGAELGDIVRVVDAWGKGVAYGFYAPGAQIVCKLFAFTAEELTVDAAFWQERLARAVELRRAHVLSEDTDACRLVFSEGDGIPGLIVDQYGDVVVMQLLTRGVEQLAEVFAEGLRSLGYRYLYARTKGASERFEGVERVSGWLGDEPGAGAVVMREHGMRLKVDIEQGQKTGMFLDQRENRYLLRQYSEGKDVLNAFAYSGGFSVAALMGGARRVDSVDISADAVALCDENVGLNGFPEAVHTGVRADCFDYLRNPQAEYDVIVLDPPAFAKNARATQAAARGYKDLNWLAFRQVRAGGVVFTFSCSRSVDTVLFRQIVFSAAADAGREVRILHQLNQPLDHPISIYHPEGEYLKGLVLKVD